MKSSTFRRLINFWSPFLGAGIHVRNISDDFTRVDVELKLRFWNKNYVGTHFGGSLYAMTDPFYMLILIQNLGRDYIVWDKGATIRFRKPGKGIVRAHFHISKEEIENIRKQADDNPKVEPQFTVYIKNESGEVVAEVDKILYVRRKDKVPPPKRDLPGINRVNS
jgi:hypothetical protein